MWNGNRHVVSTANGIQSTVNYIDHSDIDAVRPPPRGQEYERVPSPPPSSHSSDDDDFDSWIYIKTREELIGADFWKKQADLTNLTYCSGGPRGFFRPDEPENELYGPSRPKPIIIDDSLCTRNCNYDGNSSDFSNPEDDNAKSFQSTIQDILKDAQGKDNSNFYKSIPGGAVGGFYFCWRRFQHALQIKWNIVMLQRFEAILEGRSEFLEVIPKEWEDYNGQFASLYGPMDVKSKSYQALLSQFQAQRMKMCIDMLEREVVVIGKMIESKKLISEWSSTALEIKECRLELETKLEAILEASLDMNPYSNRICMDFFVLPRPTHPIQVYEVQPDELDKLIEYRNKYVTPMSNEVGMAIMEGYNPAVFDVGCTFSDQIVLQKRCCHLNGVGKNKKVFKPLYQTLLNLRAEIQEYPVGVESKKLVEKFRKTWEYLDDEPIFGDYSNEEGVLSLSDIFYPQFLGKEKRIILFPSLYEGLIITPEEILLRIWKRIKYMLDVSSNSSIKVTELKKNYEKLFDQPFYPRYWGFSNVNEFIEYSLQNFSYLADVKCLQKDEICESETLEGEDMNELENTSELDTDSWLALDEPLPPNYVFELPDPRPFDIM